MSRFPLLDVGLLPALAVGAIVGSCHGPAMAQQVLLDVKGPAPSAMAMRGVAIGDWDGDGITDLAIGAPFDSTVANYAGAVRIHSGKDGSVLAQFFGANPLDYFGWSPTRMPDLDGDGVDDLAVNAGGADNGGTDTGSVYLYAGRTGALLRRIDGPVGDVAFGSPLGSIGDVDGDGVGDLFAAGISAGIVHVHSGADGHEITNFVGTPGEYFGFAVSALDDLDGDGVKELLIGAKHHLDASGQLVGAAFVISTATGTVLRTHTGTFNAEYFGYCTTSLADLDGDAVRDYAVSSLIDDSFSFSSMVRFFSAASGTELARVSSPAKNDVPFQPWVGDAGDVNGDGFGDLAIGGSWNDTVNSYSAVSLVSGRTYAILDRIETHGRGDVGTLAPCGDFDGDGFDDLVVGFDPWPYDGEVRIYSGHDLWLGATPTWPTAGRTIEFATREGVPGALTAFVLVDYDGTSMFQVVNGLSTFDVTGSSVSTAIVPPGLGGHDMKFRSFAHGATGHLIASAVQAVHFR